jgi:hypothetical protein
MLPHINKPVKHALILAIPEQIHAQLLFRRPFEIGILLFVVAGQFPEIRAWYFLPRPWWMLQALRIKRVPARGSFLGPPTIQ